MTSYDLIVSGDCGGTNTRLSLWRVPRSQTHLSVVGKIAPGEVILNKKYLNQEHASFVEVALLFLNEAGVDEPPVCCVLACAGPILNNSVVFTNIEFGWSISGEVLEQKLGIHRVKLINDFAAMGYGLLTLRPHEYITLNEGIPEKNAPIATIGAGTGLGECFLTASNDGVYECFACEGGHSDFAPVTDVEIELYNHIRNKFGPNKRLSVERIVSGPGLATIYEFLSTKYPEKVNQEIHAKFLQAESLRGAIVGQNAQKDDLCNQAMDIFIRAYGREAGNAALKYLPRGGFYITGGLAPKNLDYFTKSNVFLDSLFDKGRVSPALKILPIYLVLTEDLGERGAHYYAFQLLGKTVLDEQRAHQVPTYQPSTPSVFDATNAVFSITYALMAAAVVAGIALGAALKR
ncbi:glucokinase [Thraustotheca clavata]|uniref:Glucokinase n=1 Tax=Thraustotheca clavata TaxID=74557 RepID=A0A1W0ABN0_9STRA|nr:glucokinase [Thraustotheca clavata]